MALRRLLLLLTVLTLVGLFAHAFWMTRTLHIDGRGVGQLITVADDRAEAGGRSVARLLEREGGWTLQCDIQAGYEWPFCEIQLRLAEEDQALDLRRFETLRLSVRARGPEAHQQLRVFLRNRDAAALASGRVADLKPHEVVFEPAAELMPVEFRLGQFMVASWWVQSHPQPAALLGPQLDQVTYLSLSTGGHVKPGRYEIDFDGAELRGPWVSAASFRLGLIALWMLSLLGYLVWEWRQTRRQLQRSIRRKLELQKQHALLQAHSQDLAAMALRDPLTGVANRDGLQHDLTLLMHAQEEALFPLAVAFVDIDHFKRINDEHGHAVGDQVLQQFAGLLKTHVQREDLVARWGGEEFVLLMPQTLAGEAATVAERLRSCLHEARWPAGLRVTASFGLAQCEEASQVDATLEAADKAMYQAKAQGRDRVVAADPAHS